LGYGVVVRRQRTHGLGAEQLLKDHVVPPLAVELAVPAINADLAKADLPVAREAAGILREDARELLPPRGR
jgi:hypothetical protein